jgi:hypothetical protein
VDATTPEFDEEEHVEPAEPDRLDGEEIAGEHRGRLPAQELPPGRPGSPRRRPKTVGEQDAPDRARRHTQAQLEQLARDPRVTPARVLACEAQYELAHPALSRRTACGSPGLRPLTTHKLPVPAQKRLRRHDQTTSA